MSRIPKNNKELREELMEAFATVKVDKRYCPQAKEMSNLAGKALSSQKIEIEAAKLNGMKYDGEMLTGQVERKR